MSNDIEMYASGAVSRQARRANQAISRYRMGAQVAVAAVDAATDVTLAKEDAYTTATGAAMASVVRVAQAQRQLEALAPEASGRLAFLGDDHALAMGELLADHRRTLRRI